MLSILAVTRPTRTTENAITTCDFAIGPLQADKNIFRPRRIMDHYPLIPPNKNVEGWILVPLLRFRIHEEFCLEFLTCCLQGIKLINTAQGSYYHDSSFE